MNDLNLKSFFGNTRFADLSERRFDGPIDLDVALDTVDTQITGKLKVNLAQETINGTLDPKPKDPSLLPVQSGIQVAGTLKNPTVTPELAKTGLRGAGAVALGTLFPPAALLPFIEPASGENVDCQALASYVDQAEKAGASR